MRNSTRQEELKFEFKYKISDASVEICTLEEIEFFEESLIVFWFEKVER